MGPHQGLAEPGPGGVGPGVPFSEGRSSDRATSARDYSVVPLGRTELPKGGEDWRMGSPSEAIFPAPHPTWPFHFLCSVFTAYAIPSFIHEPTLFINSMTKPWGHRNGCAAGQQGLREESELQGWLLVLPSSS